MDTTVSPGSTHDIEPVRWGIAGLGRLAETMAEEFAYAPEAKLVACASRSSDRSADFAARHGIARAHGAYAELFADPEVEVVHIATPHPQHRDLALAAIDAGKGVLVEKSFTATVAGTEEVVAAARAAGVFCMEAMWTRFQPAVVEAARLVAAGEIGEVRQVQADLGAWRAYDPTDRLFAPELGGGATLDLGVYVISLAQAFLGTPDRVVAHGSLAPNGVDMDFGVLLGFEGGRVATLTAGLDITSPGRAVLHGTDGWIEIEPRFHHPTRIRVAPRGGETYARELPPLGQGYCHELSEVSRLVRAGATESDRMPLADTLSVQRIMAEVGSQLGFTPQEAPPNPDPDRRA